MHGVDKKVFIILFPNNWVINNNQKYGRCWELHPYRATKSLYIIGYKFLCVNNIISLSFITTGSGHIVNNTSLLYMCSCVYIIYSVCICSCRYLKQCLNTAQV